MTERDDEDWTDEDMDSEFPGGEGTAETEAIVHCPHCGEAIPIAIERLKASGVAPSIALRGDEGETWTIGDGAQKVTGSNAALLLWLARGQEGGVSSESPLPALPSWG